MILFLIQQAISQGVSGLFQFVKSVPMVTYLVCFVVCDFEFEEKRTEIHQTLFRVYATGNQKDRVRYALEIGANITDFFEDYFEVTWLTKTNQSIEIQASLRVVYSIVISKTPD